MGSLTHWYRQIAFALPRESVKAHMYCATAWKCCTLGGTEQARGAAGDAFLCVTGAAKIKVYDRDGKERGESVLGDPYIRDTKNTKGHQSPCTSGHWHPTDRRALAAHGRAL